MNKPHRDHNDGAPQAGPKPSTTMRDATHWYDHYTLKTLPPPPSLLEQKIWTETTEYQQGVKKFIKVDPSSIFTAEQLRVIGHSTLQKLADKESSHKSNQMTTAWVNKMLHNGTIVDKISALSLQLKYQPLTTGQYIDSLLSLGSRKGQKDTNLALETLRDLFTVDLLPQQRRLKFFHEQPWIISYTSFTHQPNRSTMPPLHQYRQQPKPEVLAFFYLEDVVKRSYGRFIDHLSDHLQTSNLEHIKRHRIQLVFDLLQKVPEQEHNLLVLIINKFGDGSRGIVSRVQFLLEKLVKQTPSLKLTIIKEIERIIFRPYIKQRTQYFAILFISNILLDKSELKLAQYLLSMYLTLFQIIVTDAIPLLNDRKLASQAFIEKNKQYLAKSSKGRKAEKTKKKAKALSKHKDGGVSTKILAALLTGVSRCIPYALPTDLQSIPHHRKTDDQKQVESVLVSHIDQLIHVAASTAQTNGNVSVQALALLWQILGAVQPISVKSTVGAVAKRPGFDEKKGIQVTSLDDSSPYKELSRDPFYRCLYSLLQFPQPFTCSRVKIFLNVLFKAIKQDHSPTRVLAFVKRLLQNSITISSNVAAAILYIISNLSQIHPCISHALTQSDKPLKVYKQDIMTSLQYNQYLVNKTREDKMNEAKAIDDSGKPADFDIVEAEKVLIHGVEHWKVKKERTQTYDPFEGDPVYARSESVGLFELSMAMSHYHPTLNIWAQKIFDGELIQYAGDPINDFTPLAFFESWLNKGSKRAAASKHSIHQPQRLIIDPEIEDYMKSATNQFIENFAPLYTNRPGYEKRFEFSRETEEDFVDRLVDEELVRNGRGRKGGQLAAPFDPDDYDDFDGEFNEPDGNGEGDWDDSFAFGGEGEMDEESLAAKYDGGLDFGDADEDNEADEDDYDFDDFDDEEEDEDDFDESTLVSLDWDSLDPTKGSVDSVSEDDNMDDDEEEIVPPTKSTKGNKAIIVPASTKVAPSGKKTVQKDLFDDVNLSDLDMDDASSDGEHSDDDDVDDLREILDDDDAIAELLEESSAKTSKADVHMDKMLGLGLGGKINSKRKAPTPFGGSSKGAPKSHGGTSKPNKKPSKPSKPSANNKRQRTKK